MKLLAVLTILLTLGSCSSSSKKDCAPECDTHPGSGQCLERTNPNVPAHPMHRDSRVNDLR